MLAKRAVSVVAASAALLGPGAVQAQPVPEQIVQVVADSAAETYRQARALILNRYHERTAAAQAQLARSADRDRAWSQYKRATQQARADASAEMQKARSTFRATVAAARQGR